MPEQNRIQKIRNHPGSASFLATILAIFSGLLLGFLIMLLAGPSAAGNGILVVLTGGIPVALNAAKQLGQIFYQAVPVLLTGLSVGFVFKLGLFNIGVAGQYTMGLFFAMYAAFSFPLPSGIHWGVCLLAGMLGGALWGTLTGLLKAWRGVNEVIAAIMLNYIGMYLVDMWVQGNTAMYEASRARTKYIPASAQLPSLGISGSNLNIGIFLAIGAAVLLWIVLNKTVFGYELRATGLNPDAAVYAGMNSRRNILVTMLIGGALAGLGGACTILAPAVIPGSSVTYEPINVIAQAGFHGIAAALLGGANPLGIIFSAIFISLIRRGGSAAALYGYRLEIIDIVIAVVIYCASFSLLIRELTEKIGQKRTGAGAERSEMTKKHRTQKESGMTDRGKKEGGDTAWIR
ncbi:MAG: ABC transporter permease [Lachnospiraceae bacterium]|nr:ABC transporter permease [Lachnospiraceae bacterium]